MWVDLTMRAPDQGEVIRLVAIDSEGNVEFVGITARETLRQVSPLIEQAVARVEEEGHENAEEFMAWRDFLGDIRDLRGGVR